MLLIRRKCNMADLPLLTSHIRRDAILMPAPAAPARAAPALAAPALAVTALAALALAVTACGSAGGQHAASAPRSAATGPVDGATYTGTIYVSSQDDGNPQSWHVTKTFTERRPDVRNCAAAAKTGTGTGVFQVPSPKPPLPQDNIEVQGFHGPGTYSPSVMQRDKSDFIMMTGKSGMQQYDITASAQGEEPGKEALILYGNGSGQLVYSQAHLDGKAAGPMVAGLITWSCTS
jgi:hypothetical protein